VVTALRVKAGDEFPAGAVLVEVAGRPLVALAGEVPAYRDLRPGMTGTDVRQLQSSLKLLGHDPKTADGVFGSSTKTALRDFYSGLGFVVATTGEGDAAALAAADARVTAASRALQGAQEDLARLEAHPPSVGPGEADPVEQARKQVRFAQEDLAAAQRDRAELERTTGPMLPLSEYVFLPQFPARVEKLSAKIGAEVSPPALTLSSGALVARAGLNNSQRALLKEGMEVQILSELQNVTATGVVASIGNLTQDSSGVRSYPMVVTPTQHALDPKLAGADVRLTVQAASTDGEVLVVPISAVYADADGATVVLKVNPDGSQQRVTVTAGVTGDGYVAVTPVNGSLKAGDSVVVGARTGA
jgi:peptidoglycan hydrolase-like protein with peptidoglycan-binding domain